MYRECFSIFAKAFPREEGGLDEEDFDFPFPGGAPRKKKLFSNPLKFGHFEKVYDVE